MKINWHKLAPGITYGQMAWYCDHYSRFAIVRSGTMYELSETVVHDTDISVSVKRKTYTYEERFRTIREAKARAQQWVDTLNWAHASRRSECLGVYYAQGFGETVSFAERLGWEDTYTDDDWTPEMADFCEAEAIEFIESKGFDVVHPEEWEHEV